MALIASSSAMVFAGQFRPLGRAVRATRGVRRGAAAVGNRTVPAMVVRASAGDGNNAEGLELSKDGAVALAVALAVRDVPRPVPTSTSVYKCVPPMSVARVGDFTLLFSLRYDMDTHSLSLFCFPCCCRVQAAPSAFLAQAAEAAESEPGARPTTTVSPLSEIENPLRVPQKEHNALKRATRRVSGPTAPPPPVNIFLLSIDVGIC